MNTLEEKKKNENVVTSSLYAFKRREINDIDTYARQNDLLLLLV